MSTEGTAGTWPTPEAFNALPQSTRTKVYSDFGDEGKMAWKAHEEPPKVGAKKSEPLRYDELTT